MKTALQLVKKEKDKGPMMLGRGEARPLRACQGTQPSAGQSRARGLLPCLPTEARPLPTDRRPRLCRLPRVQCGLVGAGRSDV